MVIALCGGFVVWRNAKASQAASAPLAVAAPSYGIAGGGGLPYLSPTQLTAYMQGVKALGGQWIRFDVDWSVIQARSSSSYDWTNYDHVAQAAHAAGLKSVGVLTYTPQWARPSSCLNSNKCAPSRIAAFATFSAAAAKRYASDGMQAFEIWNEPNSRVDWLPGANAGEYAQLLRKSYQAIHLAVPHAIVLTGGLARVGDTAGNIQPPDFLATLYANNMRGSFDAVAAHPYSYPFLPTFNTPGNAWLQISQSAYNLRDIMSANGDAYKKIWITEYGAPTNGPGREATSGQTNAESGSDHVSQALQAAMASSAVALYKADASWMGPFFWYGYQDNGTDASTVEQWFGLVSANGFQKPAYAALQQAISHSP